jgi:hypothetical protein
MVFQREELIQEESKLHRRESILPPKGVHLQQEGVYPSEGGRSSFAG